MHAPTCGAMRPLFLQRLLVQLRSSRLKDMSRRNTAKHLGGAKRSVKLGKKAPPSTAIFISKSCDLASLAGLSVLVGSRIIHLLYPTDRFIVNTVILGTVGYVSYANWNRPWDRKVVSAISVGLLTLWGGEGVIAQRFANSDYQ